MENLETLSGSTTLSCVNPNADVEPSCLPTTIHHGYNCFTSTVVILTRVLALIRAWWWEHFDHHAIVSKIRYFGL